MSEPEYCVVGGGVIGSWTALHLIKAGKKTVLYEQFPLPTTRGSSHGASRVFRFLGDDTLDALEYSLDEWHALGRWLGSDLFIKTGERGYTDEIRAQPTTPLACAECGH
jgi:sarcosine oxidase/L-pipecolate oxidase